MQELDFALDGVWASTKGITLCRPVSFSAAVPRTQSVNIPGRNGALHIDEGAFNVRTGAVDCFALQASNVAGKMADITGWLFQPDGYRKLQVSDDTGHYWYARIVNAGQIATRLAMLNPFSIEFECKPFRLVNGSETYIPTTGLTEFVNPTGFKAYPLLKIEATGVGTVSRGSESISISAAGTYIIDCEDMRAYDTGGNAVDYLISSDAFPYLPPGSSGFTISSGITLQVAPRWHTL